MASVEATEADVGSLDDGHHRSAAVLIWPTVAVTNQTSREPVVGHEFEELRATSSMQPSQMSAGSNVSAAGTISGIDMPFTQSASTTSSLGSTIVHLESAVSSLGSTVTHLGSTLSELGSTVTQLRSTMSELQTNVSQLDAPSATAVDLQEAQPVLTDASIEDADSHAANLDELVTARSLSHEAHQRAMQDPAVRNTANQLEEMIAARRRVRESREAVQAALQQPDVRAAAERLEQVIVSHRHDRALEALRHNREARNVAMQDPEVRAAAERLEATIASRQRDRAASGPALRRTSDTTRREEAARQAARRKQIGNDVLERLSEFELEALPNSSNGTEM